MMPFCFAFTPRDEPRWQRLQRWTARLHLIGWLSLIWAWLGLAWHR